MEKEEIIMTGTLVRLPAPFLTNISTTRDIACRLKVRPRHACDARRKLFWLPCRTYTVIVTSKLQNILYKTAEVKDTVLISGYRTAKRYIVDAHVYKV